MSLYPPIKPYKAEFLRVSPLHKISLKQYGTASGLPVLCQSLLDRRSATH